MIPPWFFERLIRAHQIRAHGQPVDDPEIEGLGQPVDDPRRAPPTPSPPVADMSPTVSLKEAARLLGVARSTILRAIQRGELPAHQEASGRWRIDAAALGVRWGVVTAKSVPEALGLFGRRPREQGHIWRAPRGAPAHVRPFTALLQERTPLVYAYLERLRTAPHQVAPPGVRRVLGVADGEWDRVGRPRRPSVAELTAFVVERAFGDLWKRVGVQRPTDDPAAFLRRYVHGARGALQLFRQVLAPGTARRRVRPRLLPHASWCTGALFDSTCRHVVHELRWFFGAPGAAAACYARTLEPDRIEVFLPRPPLPRPRRRR